MSMLDYTNRGTPTVLRDRNSKEFQVPRIHSLSKRLGYVVQCQKERPVVLPKRQQKKRDEKYAQLEAERKRLADTHLKGKPSLKEQMNYRKVQRQLAQFRTQCSVPCLNWQVLSFDSFRVIYDWADTRTTYARLALEAYDKWEQEWDTLTMGGKFSRVKRWADNMGLIVTEALMPIDVQPTGERRRWNFWELLPPHRKLHPHYALELIGEMPDSIGFTPEQTRRLMRNSREGRGLLDLPDGLWVRGIPTTFLPTHTLPASKGPWLHRGWGQPKAQSTPAAAFLSRPRPAPAGAGSASPAGDAIDSGSNSR
jgi:hypothetical protein